MALELSEKNNELEPAMNVLPLVGIVLALLLAFFWVKPSLPPNARPQVQPSVGQSVDPVPDSIVP